MKAKIYIDPRNAVKAGSDVFGEQIIEFDPAELTQIERDELALNEIKGGVFDYFYFDSGYPLTSPTVTADLAGLKIIIADRIALREANQKSEIEAQAKLDAKIAVAMEKWVALPMSDRIRKKGYPSVFYVKFTGFPYVNHPTVQSEFRKAAKYAASHPGVASVIAETEAEAERLTVEARRKYEALTEANRRVLAKNQDEAISKFFNGTAPGFDNIFFTHHDEVYLDNIFIPEKHPRHDEIVKEIKKRKIATAERRASQISAWVAAKGTANQQARRRDGLLPNDEVIDAIRSETYDPLKDFPRYQKLKNSDVCDGYNDYAEGCYHADDIQFDVATAKTLDAGEYEQLQKIKKTAPEGAEVEARVHTGECSECETSIKRIGFMVRIRIGEFEFSREYGIDIESAE